jgi:hypothetical protein
MKNLKISKSNVTLIMDLPRWAGLVEEKMKVTEAEKMVQVL